MSNNADDVKLRLAASAPIHQLYRNLKREENCLLNRLRSIENDTAFVEQLCRTSYPALPVAANLRCGLWYCRQSLLVCCFKSGDGHYGHWKFNCSRLNLHLLPLLGQHQGIVLVDATRRGKKAPDSFSKTVPIWCSVINRLLYRHRFKFTDTTTRGATADSDDCGFDFGSADEDWDAMPYQPDADEEFAGDETLEPISSEVDLEPSEAPVLDNAWLDLFVPTWVSLSERHQLLKRIDQWADDMEQHLGASGLQEFLQLSSSINQPLRPVWARQDIDPPKLVALQESGFTPVICISASREITETTPLTMRQGWHYIPGAGDDSDNWDIQLAPRVFWANVDRFMHCIRAEECDALAIELAKSSNDAPSIGNSVVYQFKVDSCEFAIATAPDSTTPTIDISDEPSTELSHPSAMLLQVCAPDDKRHKHSLELKLDQILRFAAAALQQHRSLCVCLRTAHTDASLALVLLTAVLLTNFNSDSEFQSYSGMNTQSQGAKFGTSAAFDKELLRRALGVVQRACGVDQIPRRLLQSLNRYFLS